MQRLQEPVYYSEDRIAMYQLRFLLAQSSRLSLQENTLSFIYQKKEADNWNMTAGVWCAEAAMKFFCRMWMRCSFKKRKEMLIMSHGFGKRSVKEALLTCE